MLSAFFDCCRCGSKCRVAQLSDSSTFQLTMGTYFDNTINLQIAMITLISVDLTISKLRTIKNAINSNQMVDYMIQIATITEELCVDVRNSYFCYIRREK